MNKDWRDCAHCVKYWHLRGVRINCEHRQDTVCVDCQIEDAYRRMIVHDQKIAHPLRTEKGERMNCLRCKHLYYQEATPEYSELTPGTDMGLQCGRGHWNYDQFHTSQEELAAMLERAEICPDYERRTQIE